MYLSNEGKAETVGIQAKKCFGYDAGTAGYVMGESHIPVKNGKIR